MRRCGGVAMAVGVERRAVPTIWQIPDDLWVIVQHVLPTGCQWKAVPREFGSGSTVHRRFQRWVEHGVWEAMWRLLLQYYDAAESLEWTWQSADASLHKAPLGGEKNGAEPDRARQGGDQAPCPHRRRRRADRLGDHGSQYAGQGRAG